MTLPSGKSCVDLHRSKFLPCSSNTGCGGYTLPIWLGVVTLSHLHLTSHGETEDATHRLSCQYILANVSMEVIYTHRWIHWGWRSLDCWKPAYADLKHYYNHHVLGPGDGFINNYLFLFIEQKNQKKNKVLIHLPKLRVMNHARPAQYDSTHTSLLRWH